MYVRAPRGYGRFADLPHEVRGRAAPHSTRHHSSSEPSMMIRRSSVREIGDARRPRRRVNIWVFFDTGLALMKAQRHPTPRPRAGAMAQTRQPSGFSTPPQQPPPHHRTRLAHDPRRHGGVDVLRARVPPLRLQAGEARGTHHNGSRVTWDLCEMTATRPVPTPNLYCAPPCAKPADHHGTPHRDGRFSTPHKKKNNAAPPNFTSRTRINRHNASDVRCEGGVAPCTLGVAGS